MAGALSFLVRIDEHARLEIPDELPPSISSVDTRFQQGALRVLEVRVPVADATLAGFTSWADVMSFTLLAFDQVRTELPTLTESFAESGESWWPLIITTGLDVTGGPEPLDVPGFGRFRVAWDGGAVESPRADVVERVIDLAAQSQAQWTAVASAIETARTSLSSTGSSAQPGDLNAAIGRLTNARRRLIDGIVLLDPRVGIYYEYEVEFSHRLREAWHLDDQIALAERSLDAVEGVIQAEANRSITAAQRRQERLARSASFWLFVLTVASGLSVIFLTVDFVSTRSRPTIGNGARLAIFFGCAALTAAIGVRYQRSRGPDERP